MEALTSFLPKQCFGCRKEGIVAIRCPFQSQLTEQQLLESQCSDAGRSKEAMHATSGKTLGPTFSHQRANNGAVAPGKSQSSRWHLGAL